jgi:peptidoglycan/LPS O-acetylase OafA/YrhL
LALVLYASFTFDDLTPFPGTAALLPVLGTMLLIAAGDIGASNALTRGLSWGPMQRVGDLSYSWYLWHWPVIVFAVALFPGQGVGVAVAAAVGSLGPAVLSYRFVENPIRFKPHPNPLRTLALGTACIAVPIVAGVSLELGHRAV